MYKAKVLKPTETDGKIVSLEPKAFNTEVPKQILAVITDDDRLKQGFKVDELIAKMTGLSDHQQKNLEEQINTAVLRKLNEVQHKAYDEAYKLGQQDGKKDAFEHFSAQIGETLSKMGAILEHLDKFKHLMFLENEEHFIKLVFELAKTVTLKQIKEDKEAVLPVLKKALENIQADEEVTLKLNKEDLEFIKNPGVTLQDKQRPWDNSKKIKLEAVESVSRGGCVVETNYGIIDAQIEERLAKAWQTIEARIPKVAQD